ncbi:ent-kaurene synthase TSP4, chloroplastic isoform X2 [Malania oleifera]|uniref:ent-kaurene synthase TSP4, chloroplastic isoform X2 n=1 Tax=Malania oleifera TaxID=397392 RepID=UPI0025ADC9BC|nr:ent-kaurene synthase TSP4, chloroplastic isoform X2 [Malania oleifera]
MALSLPNTVRPTALSISASLDHGLKMVTDANPSMLGFEGTKERIKKMLNKVELSVSSYDTAWVAMIPSLNSPKVPHFPQCVNWLLDNQLHDGSWGLPNQHPLFLRDSISSTLACVLALQQWGVGEEHIKRGLQFIELNFASAIDEKQHSPIGFDIIFPGMIEHAKDLALNLPLEQKDINAMLSKREVELNSVDGIDSEGRKAYMAYISEGLGKLQDWKKIMKYQRKNGSLFNSPSTTAAAVIHLQNVNCLNYLGSIIEKFGNAVPTVYPLDIYARLCMVDDLERLGIDRHFKEEIRSVLDETYRCWLQGEEEIFLDIATCAKAFRILRANGYDISSDPLSQFAEEDHYFSLLCGHLKDMGSALELFRASELTYPDESGLQKQNLWASIFLKREISSGLFHADRLDKQICYEVNDALKFPYHAILERVANRRSIEHYNVVSTRILKSSCCSLTFGNEDLLKLAVEDFNNCQSIHLQEIKKLERWIVDSRLDQLTFARKKLAYCYFSAAATLFPPELSGARMSWAKNGVLTTVVDDFFDVGGSKEELANLIQLVEKWDVNLDADCCSEQVEIIFSALHNTICDIGDKAFAWQARNVTHHVIEIWLDLLRSMFQEAEWARNNWTPSVDEYMTNAYVSFALGPIVLPALYFVGPMLSEDAVRSLEYHNLFKLMSTCGRLLNDIQTAKREVEEGKQLNAVLLWLTHRAGDITEEETVKEIRAIIDSTRRELLRLVLQNKGSVVPHACKDLFWKMCKVVHYFYTKDDGFTSHELTSVVKAVIHEPIVLDNFWWYIGSSSLEDQMAK